MKYELPGGAGTVFLRGTPEEVAEQKRVLQGRHAFVVSYSKARGWPTEGDLSMDQILEIRAQEGWKNPVGA